MSLGSDDPNQDVESLEDTENLEDIREVFNEIERDQYQANSYLPSLLKNRAKFTTLQKY